MNTYVKIQSVPSNLRDCFLKVVFIDGLVLERERNIDLLFHLFLHSLADSCVCPEAGPNPHHWCMRQRSNHLSYPSRAQVIPFLKRLYHPDWCGSVGHRPTK